MTATWNSSAQRAGDHSTSHLVRTRYGIEFDAREDWWPIDGRQGIAVGPLRALVSPALRDGLELTLRDCARRYSWATMSQFSWALRHFQKTVFDGGVIDAWKLTDVRGYRAALIKEFGHEDYLRQIRSMLTNWLQGRYPGVTEEFVVALKAMRLKGAEAGRAVRIMDPHKGPLTPDELHGLMQGLNDAAESGQLDLDAFSFAYLHLVTGRRPVQSAYLKCKDVVQRLGDPESAYPQGRPLYLLAVPRAKQRGHAFRETRRGIDLTLENFQLFQAQRDSVQSLFRARLDRNGWTLQSGDLQHLLDELPLYPRWAQIDKALEEAGSLRDRGQHGAALDAMRADAAASAWHWSPKEHGLRLTRICESVGALSRDGEPLQVNAARLRHTKGTDLAREGLPAHVIAWLLDHSTSRSAEIYVDNLPEHAAQINGAMSKSVVMQRFASAFRGTLVDSESEALHGGNPSQSRLSYGGKGAATCGHLKQCGLDGGVPHACYTCSHFQPWLDGPHDQFLADLLKEREDAVASLGADSPVAKRRDVLIAAVANVVDLCSTRRAELHSADGGGSIGEAA